MNEPLTRDQADKIIAEGEKRYSALLEMRIDQLERELNAANEKIKKLEEARLDKMERLATDIIKLHRPDSEAKEAKP